MKNSTALIVWNLLLTLAVAFLLFQKFSTRDPGLAQADADHSDTISGSDDAIRIAYVNIDSLQAHYALYEEKKKELEQKQQQSEASLNKMINEFQNDYVAAQQSAATMTESQLQAIQQKLQQKQADIQQRESSLQSAFQNDLEKANRQLKDSLDSFIRRYYSSLKKNFDKGN